MVFDMIDTWVRVANQSLDKRSDALGEGLGNWLREVVKVDVEEDVLARGKNLRVLELG